MALAALLVGIFLISIVLAPPAKAIIFLPALILIPIAKIVAVIIGGFSIPALGLATLWNKLFGTSLKRTLLVVGVILVIIALILILVLKIHNPDRPWF